MANELNALATTYTMQTGCCWHYLDGPRKWEVTPRFRAWLKGRRVPRIVRRLIEESDRDARRMNRKERVG